LCRPVDLTEGCAVAAVRLAVPRADVAVHAPAPVFRLSVPRPLLRPCATRVANRAS
jgi:hypothetical protein